MFEMYSEPETSFGDITRYFEEQNIKVYGKSLFRTFLSQLLRNEDGTLEMLFISPEERGKGLGRRLIQYGIENYAVERLTVNEQNPQAKGFYEHMGFHVYKRTDLDEQGNPYPLLYMSLSGVD